MSSSAATPLMVGAWPRLPWGPDGDKLRFVLARLGSGVYFVKKGRHRRFQEARDLKRAVEIVAEPCPECGAEPGSEHAAWCLAMEDEEYDGDEGDDEEEPSLAVEDHAARPNGALP
jgi:hypothetical protein